MHQLNQWLYKKIQWRLTMAAAQISLLIVYIKYNYKGAARNAVWWSAWKQLEVKRANAIINYKSS
jgi:hypothetical protein